MNIEQITKNMSEKDYRLAEALGIDLDLAIGTKLRQAQEAAKETAQDEPGDETIQPPPDYVDEPQNVSQGPPDYVEITRRNLDARKNRVLYGEGPPPAPGKKHRTPSKLDRLRAEKTALIEEIAMVKKERDELLRAVHSNSLRLSQLARNLRDERSERRALSALLIAVIGGDDQVKGLVESAAANLSEHLDLEYPFANLFYKATISDAIDEAIEKTDAQKENENVVSLPDR